VKKGRSAESMARQELNKSYEKSNIIKAAQWQRCPDYLLLPDKKGIEVKNRMVKKFYANDHDREQWEDHFKAFLKSNTEWEINYWIYTREGRYVKKETLSYEEFGIKYLKMNQCSCCKKLMKKSIGNCVECQGRCSPGIDCRNKNG